MTNLNDQMKSINKEFGEGTINTLSNFGNMNIERTPTGSYSLDRIMGGGLPSGRIVEIYGEPMSGKSLMSLFMIAEIQKNGGKAAYFDCENAFSVEFAKNIGVDTDNLIFSQSVCAEDVLNTIYKLVETNEISVIVLDSVASMIPQKELDGEIGDAQVALMARILSQAMRKITSVASKTKTSIIFINQIRSKIGVFYGNPNITPGGKALKFYSSIRLEVRKGKNIEGKDKEAIGNIVKIFVTKNKTATPFKNAELDLYYDSGIDIVSDVFDEAVKREVIVKSGNTYSFLEEKLGVGRDTAKAFLKEHQDIFDNIIKELKK